ncbi:GldG family protein [bacterium]|nr:GldG family protein [bacterium]
MDKQSPKQTPIVIGIISAAILGFLEGLTALIYKIIESKFVRNFIIGTLLLLGIVLSVNMIFDNLNLWRGDLTAEQVYKLSPSVKKILGELEAPIEVTYYVSSSEKMPTQWKNLERDVIDKLKDIEVVSKGMLTYKVFDPSAEEEKEAYEESKQEDEEDGGTPEKPAITRKKIAERLYEKGVIPFGVQSTEQDEFAIKRVYSSIVLSYLDRKEDVIEEVRPETFGSLEYDIMSRIYKLISNKRPRIGFYPSQPEIPPQMRQYYRQQTPPDMYETTVQVLKEQGYDVVRTNIKEDDPVPENIQTMIVMADQPLNDRQLYEIDKLVHNGVRLIIAGNMHNYQVQPARNAPGEFELRGMPTQVNINDLSKAWGFELDSKMFMDKSTTYIQVPVYKTRSMGLFQVREQRMEPVTKPVMIRVTGDHVNSRLSIANGISDLFYIYGTRILVNEDKMEQDSLTSKTLFTSSDFSWTREGYGYGPVDENPPAEENVLLRQPLAVIFQGRFEPKYGEGATIPAWPQEPGEESADTAERSSENTGRGKETKIIAIGNSMMFQSHILPNVISHKALLINCVDALTLGDELINIRAKNLTARRIRETSPGEKAAAKFATIWLVPILFVGLGIYLNIRRKNR